jgi:hypothetical protein
VKELDIGRLHQLFELTADGRLIWRVTKGSRAKAGSVAGTTMVRGYREVHIDGVRYYIHRIVFAMQNNRWPSGPVDHESTNKLENSPSNLRDATNRQNMCNKGLISTNKTGVKGVSWCKERNKFQVHIMVNKRSISLGRFDSLDDAAAAYAAGAAKYHGEFHRTADAREEKAAKRRQHAQV